jgi:hypothetical protein
VEQAIEVLDEGTQWVVVQSYGPTPPPDLYSQATRPVWID